MTVGGALMVTSVFWGGFAYMSAPKLELAGDLTKITQVPVTNTGPADVASAVGATIIDKDKATIGTIKDVVLTSPTQAAGYVVDLAGSKPIESVFRRERCNLRQRWHCLGAFEYRPVLAA
jgi:hypothetical protein